MSVRATVAPKTPFMSATLKCIGRIYQQTFIDTYSKVGFTKLYDRKTALLNDRVLPFFEA